ncbi:hypothetical protein [Amycolatopsis alkalitolerans]|uniref:hypothetical protein n=1 Tax=Amycolatopsis alkalitolerans TaxID=2547244 RepID=UPI001F213A06|nr:hypothetical protein [Amycolatopsis alkalitolerans]
MPDLAADAARLGLPPVVATERLTGGYRDDNTRLDCADGSRYVLRRYSHGDRAEVEAALARLVSGAVPVASVVAVEPGLLVTEFVPGTPVDVLVHGSRLPKRADSERRPGAC